MKNDLVNSAKLKFK